MPCEVLYVSECVDVSWRKLVEGWSVVAEKHDLFQYPLALTLSLFEVELISLE